MEQRTGSLSEAMLHEAAATASWLGGTTLAKTVVRHDYFSTDLTDEFAIIRETGEAQGIFKVWAPHILPDLDQPGEGAATSEGWAEGLRDKPLSLYQSLEQWRAFSEVNDRRLQAVFQERPLVGEPEDVMAELYLRINVAFAYAAPFYNIEALIVEPRENREANPIDFETEQVSGGHLYVVAMVLPAAFKRHVSTEPGDWKNLNWQMLHAATDELHASFLRDHTSPEAAEYTSLLKIARLANITPEEVLFVANALQFMPQDAGGKRDDLGRDEAFDTLVQILDDADSEVTTTGVVAKNVNALIRFLNWCPAIKADDNFDGKLWKYGAVCDTAATLFQLVAEQSEVAFGQQFGQIFTDQLKPQLDNLDASSARGRFLMQLLHDGMVHPDVTAKIQSRASNFNAVVSSALEARARQEMILDVSAPSSTYLTGGKAQGLRRAAHVFGPERVAGGQVITSEAVSGWLHGDPDVADLLGQLELASDTEERILLGGAITKQIRQMSPPATLLGEIRSLFEHSAEIVIRSSSYDEDVDIIGPAPGIYESVVGVDPDNLIAMERAFKEVVASFFSEHAIAFRDGKGLRHKPLFAVLVQEYLQGAGGTAFIKDGSIKLNIAESPDRVNQADGAHAIEEFSLSAQGTSNEELRSRYFNQRQIREVLSLAEKSEVAFGPSDIEFVLNDMGDVVLLQLRNLIHPPQRESAEISDSTAKNVLLHNPQDLPDLTGEERVNIHFGESIDLEKFQGTITRWIVTNHAKIKRVVPFRPVPATCHFANVVQTLGITLGAEQE